MNATVDFVGFAVRNTDKLTQTHRLYILVRLCRSCVIFIRATTITKPRKRRWKAAHISGNKIIGYFSGMFMITGIPNPKTNVIMATKHILDCELLPLFKVGIKQWAACVRILRRYLMNDRKKRDEAKERNKKCPSIIQNYYQILDTQEHHGQQQQLHIFHSEAHNKNNKYIKRKPLKKLGTRPVPLRFVLNNRASNGFDATSTDTLHSSVVCASLFIYLYQVNCIRNKHLCKRNLYMEK